MRTLILTALLASSLLSPVSASNPPSLSPATSQAAIAVGDILGKWVTSMPEETADETINDGRMYLTFGRGGDLQLLIEVEGKDTESGMEMTMNITCPLSYTLSDDVVTVSPTDTPPQLKLIKLEIPAEMEAALSLAGMTKDSLIEAFEEQVRQQGTEQWGNEISGELTIESLTATDLVLIDNSNKTMSFKRVIPD